MSINTTAEISGFLTNEIDTGKYLSELRNTERVISFVVDARDPVFRVIASLDPTPRYVQLGLPDFEGIARIVAVSEEFIGETGDLRRTLTVTHEWRTDC